MATEQGPVAGETAAEDLRNVLQMLPVNGATAPIVLDARRRIVAALTKLESGEQTIRAAYGVRKPVGIAPRVPNNDLTMIVCDDGSVWEGDGLEWTRHVDIPGSPAAIEQERRARAVDRAS